MTKNAITFFAIAALISACGQEKNTPTQSANPVSATVSVAHDEEAKKAGDAIQFSDEDTKKLAARFKIKEEEVKAIATAISPIAETLKKLAEVVNSLQGPNAPKTPTEIEAAQKKLQETASAIEPDKLYAAFKPVVLAAGLKEGEFAPQFALSSSGFVIHHHSVKQVKDKDGKDALEAVECVFEIRVVFGVEDDQVSIVRIEAANGLQLRNASVPRKPDILQD